MRLNYGVVVMLNEDVYVYNICIFMWFPDIVTQNQENVVALLVSAERFRLMLMILRYRK